MSTFGPDYDEGRDGKRIAKQLETIRLYMLGSGWKTLREIAQDTGYPESSVSEDLRHLRKPDFGSYSVEKRRRGEGGTWEYRVIAPDKIDDHWKTRIDADGQVEMIPSDPKTYER